MCQIAYLILPRERREAAEEYLADLAETNGVPVEKIYRENRAAIDAWGRERGYDTHDLNEKGRMTRDWMADTGYRPERPSWLKQLISSIRIWLHRHGWFVHHLSDDDILTILARSAKAVQNKKFKGEGLKLKDESSVVKENLTTAEASADENGITRYDIENIKDDDIRQAFPVNNWKDAKNILTGLSNKILTNRENANLPAKINRTQRDKLVSGKAVRKTVENGFSVQDHMDALANIEQLYSNAVLLNEGPDKNNQPEVIIRRFAAPFVIRGEICDALLTQKANLNDSDSNRVYSLELDEIIKPSGETWVVNEKYDYPADGINKLQQKHEKIKSFLEQSAKKRFSIAPDVDSKAFKKWFGNSKVVDENGKPLVVYHGSTADFTVFSYKFANRHGQADGRGFYFTDNRAFAEGYQNKDGKLFEVYLSIQKPLNPDELTITKAELRKVLDAIDPSGDYMANYAEDDRGYPGATWRARALNSTLNAIYDSAESNADILAELYGSFGGGWVLEEVRKVTGYDGFIKKDQNGNMIYIAFEPGQIKSATDNVGTYDRNNPDIRYSISDLWTGSAADYDAPSLHYVGTGEGAQVYGWGLYAADQRGIAEWYAKQDVNSQ